jgi:LCP family protein required for cell wall assembly
LLLAALLIWQAGVGVARQVTYADPRARGAAANPALAATQQAQAAAALTEPMTVLLLGVDRRPLASDGVRSDVVMLARFHPGERWVSLLSIPRDTTLPVPGVGHMKVNATYGHGFANATSIYGADTTPEAGGAAFTAEALERYMNININHVAQVDFRSFEQLIDGLGGITLDVPQAIDDREYPTENYGIKHVQIPAGLQRMDGETALIYVRTRHGSDDYKRNQRQQQVLRAVQQELRAKSPLWYATELPGLVSTLAPNIRTTLPIDSMPFVLALAQVAQELDGQRIQQLGITPDTVVQEGVYGSNLYWNRDSLAQLVAQWQEGPRLPGQPGQVQVLNGAALQGLAGKVTNTLQQAGFKTAEPGNAPYRVARTRLIDYGGNQAQREQLMALLKLTPADVETAPRDQAPSPRIDLVVIAGPDAQP